MGQRIIYVSTSLIERALRQGQMHARSQVSVGLPNDARYVRCFDHPTREGMLGLVFESSEWVPARQGSEIPEHTITLQNASI